MGPKPWNFVFILYIYIYIYISFFSKHELVFGFLYMKIFRKLYVCPDFYKKLLQYLIFILFILVFVPIIKISVKRKLLKKKKKQRKF